MTTRARLFTKKSKALGGAGLSLLLGIIGGGCSGAAILVFSALIGRIGTTGIENVRDWIAAVVWPGFLYGGLIGAFLGPLAYALVVRKVGIKKALPPAFVGTLAGGLAGAVAGPIIAMLTGVLGFFIAIYWAKARGRDATSPGGR